MATISKTLIANMALSNVGAKNTIESLDNEQSTEAAICRIWYDHSRIMTLEAYNWSFAKKRAALTEDTEDPPDGLWGFRYQLPADCIHARELENPTVVNQSIIRGQPTTLVQADAIPFEIEMTANGERRTLLTDLDDAILLYTFDQIKVDRFSRAFVLALSYALGMYIAFPLTGKLTIKQEMSIDFAKTVVQAAAQDANERVGRQPRDADWIRGRS